MTTTKVETPLPATIRLGQLAIAAGLAGYSVLLVYHDFDPAILAEVWKYHAGKVGRGAVAYIETRRELQQLVQSKENHARLVFVRNDRLLPEISWTIERTYPSAGQGAEIRPAVFAIASTRDADDAPGARLDIYASPAEEQEIAAWLQRLSESKKNQSLMPETPVTVGFAPRIEELCWPKKPGSDSPGLTCLRHGQLLRALAAGACVLRSQAHGGTSATTVEATIGDYAVVRTLLTGTLARPAGQPFNPLAVAMVVRANAYLKMLHEKAALQTGRQEEGNGSVDRPRQITRRELADLGNQRSKVTRRLIEFLLDQPEGFKRFCRLGLDRKVSNDHWQEAKAQLEIQKQLSTSQQGKAKTPAPKAIAYLIHSLQPWSDKQVRGHFNRLVDDKLITAERPVGNGPWKYTLPEELTGRSAFHNLPTPAMIQAELAAGADVSTPKAACPTCPPSAQAAGQIEVEQQHMVTAQKGPIAPIFEV